MYSLQAIWTIARERLDVTICIWANRAYAILKGELAGVGVEHAGRTAQSMLSLSDPPLDWVKNSLREWVWKAHVSHPRKPSPKCLARRSGKKGRS